MKTPIPAPALERLCSLYQLLCRMEGEDLVRVSSTELGRRTGQPAHTIRKDISFLGEIGNSGAGYEVSRLKDHLFSKLGLQREKRACIVGLGRLGSAILSSSNIANEAFRIVAGFDSDVNKLETIKTAIMVFPSHEIADVVRRMAIELAIIAVPAARAQEVADRLAGGGHPWHSQSRADARDGAAGSLYPEYRHRRRAPDSFRDDRGAAGVAGARRAVSNRIIIRQLPYYRITGTITFNKRRRNGQSLQFFGRTFGSARTGA